jgi:hypothetical protein
MSLKPTGQGNLPLKTSGLSCRSTFMVFVLSIEESDMTEKTLAHYAFSMEILHLVAKQ